MDLALRCDRALERSGCTLEVFLLNTLQNPADDPSRNRRVSDQRLELFWQAVEAAEHGRHAEPPITVKPISAVAEAGTGGLRHGELEDAVENENSDSDNHIEWLELDEMIDDN
jgi:hypothetical protein